MKVFRFIGNYLPSIFLFFIAFVFFLIMRSNVETSGFINNFATYGFAFILAGFACVVLTESLSEDKSIKKTTREYFKKAHGVLFATSVILCVLYFLLGCILNFIN